MPILTDSGTLSVEAPESPFSVQTPAPATPSVERPPQTPLSVETPAAIPSVEDPARVLSVVVMPTPGPPGPEGPAGPGGVGFEVTITEPAATWTIPVPAGFGRTPGVMVIVGGRLVITDVSADPTTVTVIHPEPTVGSVVLN